MATVALAEGSCIGVAAIVAAGKVALAEGACAGEAAVVAAGKDVDPVLSAACAGLTKVLTGAFAGGAASAFIFARACCLAA